MKKIGVVGCGLMGSGIAKNLLKNDYSVYVYDINEEAVNKLSNEGAIKSSTINVMAEIVDCVILSLPTPELIKEIVLGENGIIQSMKQGTYILDMSTNDVSVTKELYEKAKVDGIEFFDCPLSGGPEGAAKGTLTIMVGGNKKTYLSISPILNVVGENIEYIGESGMGQSVKICHNMVVGGVITLLAEAFLTGEKAGVSKEKLASILEKGSANTRVMDVFGSNILNCSFSDIKFSLENMNKDIGLYHRLADHNLIPTFASESVRQIFQMANNKGKGSKDLTAIYEVLVEMEKVKF